MFLSFFSLPSSQPILSFYSGVFWASWGTVGSPVLVFCKQSMFCPHHLGKSPFPFSLILSFSWFWFLQKLLVGHPLWDVLRYALLGILTSGVFYFSVSFLFGRNPVLLFWNRFVIILLPCLGSPTPFLSVPWRVTCVLLFFSCFLSIDLSWSSFSLRLLMVPEDPCVLYFAVMFSLFLLWLLFLFWASGSSGPFV